MGSEVLLDRLHAKLIVEPGPPGRDVFRHYVWQQGGDNSSTVRIVTSIDHGGPSSYGRDEEATLPSTKHSTTIN